MVGRPDISVVVPIHKPNTPQARTVLVAEFRTPVRNTAGMVIDELHEETGFLLHDPTRLVPLGSRQVAATLASHHAHVFALELTDLEMALIEARAGIVHDADEEERTTLVIQPLATLETQPLDWSAIGMVKMAEKALK